MTSNGCASVCAQVTLDDTLCTQTDTLMKKTVALKVLVWSMGRLVTLQILTSSFFPGGGSRSSSGQCVAFSLIDVGSGFTAIFFLFYILILANGSRAYVCRPCAYVCRPCAYACRPC